MGLNSPVAPDGSSCGGTRRTFNLIDVKSPWRWFVFVTCLLLFTTACGAGRPAPRPLPLRAVSDTTTVTKQVSASLSITSNPEGDSRIIKAVEVSPNTIVVDPGETVEVSARALGSDGKVLYEVDFIWAVVDPRAGWMNRETEFVAGVTPGVFEGAVAVTGLQNTPFGIQHARAVVSVVVVGDAPTRKLTGVSIFPENPVALSGQIYRLWAVGFDEDGLVIPDVSFRWTVSTPSLGRVNEIGYLTVEAQGGDFGAAVTATGTWEETSLSATTDIVVVESLVADEFLNVEVLPHMFHMDPGQRLQLRAVALNGLGEMVTGTEMRWDIGDSRAGAIDGRGLFVAGNIPGTYSGAVRVEAIVPGESGFVRAFDYASVVVRKERPPRRLEAVHMLPESVVIDQGGSVLLLVRAVDEFGKPADGVRIVWDGDANAPGSIDEYGNFTATGRPGLYPDALRVTVEQRLRDEVITLVESVDLTITGTLTTVHVRPGMAIIAPRRTVHFTVVGRDENGVVLSGLVVRWRVTDPQVGTIDAFGNLMAGQVPGTYHDVVEAEVIQTIQNQY